ncbi:hypothetical protein GCM10010191_62880 [Actinomadura vinacea]|uniref:Uncharacterized protein n=1 Tax=Actinomadura vinacea TaxID=115336 RepID=A0ABP5WWY9_9ACTN
MAAPADSPDNSPEPSGHGVAGEGEEPPVTGTGRAVAAPVTGTIPAVRAPRTAGGAIVLQIPN